jgi:hypothetical protein
VLEQKEHAAGINFPIIEHLDGALPKAPRGHPNMSPSKEKGLLFIKKFCLRSGACLLGLMLFHRPDENNESRRPKGRQQKPVR